MCTYNTISTHTDHFEIQKRDSEEILLTFVNLHSHLTYLHTVDSTLLLEYNQSVTTTSESRLFGSVVRVSSIVATLDRFLVRAWEYFQLCFIQRC